MIMQWDEVGRFDPAKPFVRNVRYCVGRLPDRDPDAMNLPHPARSMF
jgi:hypothetical protein